MLNNQACSRADSATVVPHAYTHNIHLHFPIQATLKGCSCLVDPAITSSATHAYPRPQGKAALRRGSDVRGPTTAYSSAKHSSESGTASGLTPRVLPQAAGADVGLQLSGHQKRQISNHIGRLRSRAVPDLACAAADGTTFEAAIFPTTSSTNAASSPTHRTSGRNRAQQQDAAVTRVAPHRGGEHKQHAPAQQPLPDSDPTARINVMLQQRSLPLRVTPVPDDARSTERAQICNGIHKLISLLCDAADASGGDDPLTNAEVVTALTGLDRIGLTVVLDSDPDMAVRQHRGVRAGLSRSQLYRHGLAIGMDDIDREIRGSPVVDRATTWAVATAQLQRASTASLKCAMCHSVFDSQRDLLAHVELCRAGTASPPKGGDDASAVAAAGPAAAGRLVLLARLRKLKVKVDYDGMFDHELRELVRGAEGKATSRNTSSDSETGES